MVRRDFHVHPAGERVLLSCRGDDGVDGLGRSGDRRSGAGRHTPPPSPRDSRRSAPRRPRASSSSRAIAPLSARTAISRDLVAITRRPSRRSQRPGDHRGGHLAHRMPDHRIGLAPRSERHNAVSASCMPTTTGCIRSIPLSASPPASTSCSENPSLRQRSPAPVGDGGGERRLVGQQPAAHPRPLRALTRVHEHRPGAARSPVRVRPRRWRARPPRPAHADRRPPRRGRPRRPCRTSACWLRWWSRVCATCASGTSAPGPVIQSASIGGHLGHAFGVLAGHHQGGDRRRRREARAHPRRAPCSSTTCAFVPPKPNDDTPARRGRPVAGHAVGSATTLRRRSSNGMCGLGLWKCRFGGDRAALQRQRRLDQPDDARPPPPGGRGWSSRRRPAAARPGVVRARTPCPRARASIGSPSSVPVPCAST